MGLNCACIHATADVQCAGKVYFETCHCPKQAQEFNLSVQALTFFPFFLAFPVLEVCGGG